MFVHSVLLFIQKLQRSHNLESYDADLISSLLKRFNTKSPSEIVLLDDIRFLLDCYLNRSLKIVDRENDYLLNPSGINRIWILFAHELAECTGKKYYQILLPNITNTIDFNILTPLTETTNLDNFYLGIDGHTLYRKRGLCEHLLKNGCYPSTYADLSARHLRALTVEEFSRLKFCRQTKGNFSIEKEQFDDFWDFMKKKVLIHLKDKGRIPLELMPHLLSLIEKYYLLKSTKADHSHFKNETKGFFKLLLETELENINYFYGLRISYEATEYYLLDFLIALSRSHSYDLDRVLNALLIWLYKFNPALKSTSLILAPVYASIGGQHISSTIPSSTASTSSNGDTLISCYNLILSLLTTSFEILPLTGGTISLWDKSNVVCSEALEMYQYFLPALMNNRTDELELLYLVIIKQFLISRLAETGFFVWFTRFHSTTLWLQLVEQGKLDNIDIIWYEPELILQTLIHFKPRIQTLSSEIDLFLDDLIHTYSQNSSDLLKAFRVNILFTELMKSFKEYDKNNLRVLLQLYDLAESKANFLNNCAKHIGIRLRNISASPVGGTLHFYVVVRPIDSSKLSISTKGLNQISDIIEAFKEALHSPKKHIDRTLLEKMNFYLRGLMRPILTVKDIELAQNSARYSDFLASPT